MHGRQWCLRKTNYDRSALKYAILSGAPMKVARLLQAVTINQTKKQAHEMSTMLVRRASQDSHDHGNEQQHQTIVSEPSEREHDPTKFLCCCFCHDFNASEGRASSLKQERSNLSALLF